MAQQGSERPRDRGWAHIQTPRVTDPLPDGSQRGRSKGKWRWSPRVLLESEKGGNAFSEMNDAGRGSTEREELPLVPSPFPARLLLSRKPPS